MAFSLYRGKAPVVQFYPKIASTAFAVGDAVVFDGAGAVKPATAADGTLVGYILRAVVASDADFALTTSVPIVASVVAGDEFLVDVGTGTLTTAMVGSTFDLTDASSIDVTASVNNPVIVTQFVSASKAVVAYSPALI